ncbi:MAG TPA: DUF3105 domain-containing protein [Solirubrobacter sp.]|nr:DUF3105 domain-containing protein [Solirubrobacter sp.]
MSSRQEEKERRRREREEKERAEKAAAARRKRLQLIFGVLLAVIVVGGGTALAVGALGGEDSGPRDAPVGGADIPERQIADLEEAAKAAGCKLVDAPNEGAGHEEKEFKPSDYKQNPPTSGPHFPQWYQDGIYEPGGVPELGQLVHTLEHGRINIQYKPGTPANVVRQLETLYNEMDGGYHLLLYENTTGMPFAVAATAWDHQLGCPTMNPKVFDAIRAFRDEYIDQGPEKVA